MVVHENAAAVVVGTDSSVAAMAVLSILLLAAVALDLARILLEVEGTVVSDLDVEGSPDCSYRVVAVCNLSADCSLVSVYQAGSVALEGSDLDVDVGSVVADNAVFVSVVGWTVGSTVVQPDLVQHDCTSCQHVEKLKLVHFELTQAMHQG